MIGSLPSAFVLIFNPEQPNEGVYTRDGAVVAFESQEDADLFAHLIVKEGFALATPLSWSASKLTQFSRTKACKSLVRLSNAACRLFC